jgi:hypothetical protein
VQREQPRQPIGDEANSACDSSHSDLQIAIANEVPSEVPSIVCRRQLVAGRQADGNEAERLKLGGCCRFGPERRGGAWHRLGRL